MIIYVKNVRTGDPKRKNKNNKIQNTKYKIQNTKYKIQNTKYKIQNTMSFDGHCFLRITQHMTDYIIGQITSFHVLPHTLLPSLGKRP